MSNEKYLNYYIETLSNTLSEAVLRNVSLQANARVTDEALQDQVKRIQELESLLGDLKEHDNDEIVKLRQQLNEAQNTINRLNNDISGLNSIRSEYENVKNQVQHIDTFRNELVKTRDEMNRLQNDIVDREKKIHFEYAVKIKELNEKIEYLQLTPAKRKKYDEEKANQKQPVKEEVKVEQKEPATKAKIIKQELPGLVVKDGGSF